MSDCQSEEQTKADPNFLWINDLPIQSPVEVTYNHNECDEEEKHDHEGATKLKDSCRFSVEPTAQNERTKEGENQARYE